MEKVWKSNQAFAGNESPGRRLWLDRLSPVDKQEVLSCIRGHKHSVDFFFFFNGGEGPDTAEESFFFFLDQWDSMSNTILIGAFWLDVFFCRLQEANWRSFILLLPPSSSSSSSFFFVFFSLVAPLKPQQEDFICFSPFLYIFPSSIFSLSTRRHGKKECRRPSVFTNTENNIQISKAGRPDWWWWKPAKLEMKRRRRRGSRESLSDTGLSSLGASEHSQPPSTSS